MRWLCNILLFTWKKAIPMEINCKKQYILYEMRIKVYCETKISCHEICKCRLGQKITKGMPCF